MCKAVPVVSMSYFERMSDPEWGKEGGWFVRGAFQHGLTMRGWSSELHPFDHRNCFVVSEKYQIA